MQSLTQPEKQTREAEESVRELWQDRKTKKIGGERRNQIWSMRKILLTVGGFRDRERRIWANNCRQPLEAENDPWPKGSKDMGTSMLQPHGTECTQGNAANLSEFVKGSISRIPRKKHFDFDLMQLRATTLCLCFQPVETVK